MRPIKTILVPTDFSAASERALAYARHLADGFGATLHVLHVLEDPFVAGGYMGLYTPAPGDYLERAEARAQARMEALFTKEQRETYSPLFATRIGLPAQQILDYVATHGGIDLVVIATGGHGRVARLMLGSVADKIVRQSPCPVLTVHPHDRTDAAGEHRAA